MINIKRLSFGAVLFLVLARISIGWQFFYEGLWKYRKVGTASEWSAAPYLRASRGPLREHYRGMLDDPDDLNWLDYDWVDKRWNAWEKKFVDYYGLTDEKKKQFQELMNGPEEIVGNARLPEIANDLKHPRDPSRANIGGSLAKAIELRKFTETDKNGRERTVYRFVVKGDWHLTPRERDILMRMGKRAEDKAKKEVAAAKTDGNAGAQKTAQRQADLAAAFQRAVRDVYKQNAKLAFRERLTVLLKGDTERISFVNPDLKGTIDYKRPAKTSEYKDRLKRYEESLAEADTDFENQHLTEETARIFKLHNELVLPVQQLEWQMQQDAQKLLTDAQRDKGRIPIAPPTKIDQINLATMWGLMIIGGLLIVGFFSRLSALAGGLLVLSFYLAIPPWPGVPDPPGPEHALFINKNAVEVMALFALAFIPTGKYFGIDALFIGLWGGKPLAESKPRKKSKSATKKSSAPPDKAASANVASTANTPAADVYSVRHPKG